MTAKGKNLYLYLTLACFLGLIAIFIVDGYMGIYDTLHIAAGEREEKIEPDFWLRGDYPWSTGVNEGEKIFFRYELDNRQFSQYATDIEVSVWRMQEKILDVTSQPMLIAPFDKGGVEWVLNTAELKPSNIPPEQSYEFSVIIITGEIERRVILYVNVYPLAYPKPPVSIR